MRQFDFSGKHAVITGGNSGIGNSIARTFAKNGAHVHILDLVEEQGKLVIQAFEAEKYKATFHICDVSKQKNVMTVFQIIAKDHPIDILVNNAGIANIGNAENTSEEDFDQVYAVNVKGVYNCLHACIPIMRSNGGGIGLCNMIRHFAIWDQICVAGHSNTQLVEYIDFLQDGVFENPVAISNGAYVLPSNPGWGLEMDHEFIENHIYPNGSVWKDRQENSGVTFLAN